MITSFIRFFGILFLIAFGLFAVNCVLSLCYYAPSVFAVYAIILAVLALLIGLLVLIKIDYLNNGIKIKRKKE